MAHARRGIGHNSSSSKGNRHGDLLDQKRVLFIGAVRGAQLAWCYSSNDQRGLYRTFIRSYSSNIWELQNRWASPHVKLTPTVREIYPVALPSTFWRQKQKQVLAFFVRTLMERLHKFHLNSRLTSMSLLGSPTFLLAAPISWSNQGWHQHLQ